MVVGDLVQQLAVLLLGAGAHLVQTDVLPQCVDVLLPVLRVVRHPGYQAFAQVGLAETKTEVRHFLLPALQTEDLRHGLHI